MGVKWIGDQTGQEGIIGIPGRDMSDEEIQERGLHKKWLIKTGLYVEVKRKKKSHRRLDNGERKAQKDTNR